MNYSEYFEQQIFDKLKIKCESCELSIDITLYEKIEKTKDKPSYIIIYELYKSSRGTLERIHSSTRTHEYSPFSVYSNEYDIMFELKDVLNEYFNKIDFIGDVKELEYNEKNKDVSFVREGE